MCDPFTLFAVASTVTAGVTVVNALDAKKEREAAAARAKQQATETKRAADIEARQDRKDEYQSRRTATPRNPQAAPGSLFAPRSFFSPV